MSKRDLSGRVRKVTLPTCVWMYFLELENVVLSIEQKQGYGSICSIGNDRKGWIKEGGQW